MIEPSGLTHPIIPLDSLISTLCELHKQRVDLLENLLATSEAHGRLLCEVSQLEQDFISWEEAQGNELRPDTIGTVNELTPNEEYNPGYFPGKVDTYLDLYIACIWNVYRAARLFLIELKAKIQIEIDNDESLDSSDDSLHCLVEDMLSSIPYHITENLHTFVQNVDHERSITTPGKIAYGLLLTHPLHVVSNLPSVDTEVRDYMKRCLVWIGKNMGIGQAFLMAEVR